MRRSVVGAVLMVVAMSSPASAATTTVQVGPSGDNRFAPAAVAFAAGNTVEWRKASETFHNVRSTTAMFRSGDATMSAFTYRRTFSAGTFPYVCEIHGAMTGLVRVRPRISSAPTGAPFTVRWATSATNTGSRFRVEYRVGDGAWRLWRSATTAPSATFGSSSQPVRAVAGRTYSFRVRSLRGADASGYSPASRFTP